MEEKKYNESGFPVLPKTLRDILKEGDELKRANGHVVVTKLGELLVGRLTDFYFGETGIDRSECTVIYDKRPEANGRPFVKKVNCYSVVVEVKFG
jgi:hypothetical protein